MVELRKRGLSNYWQDQLNKRMEKHFPEIIEGFSLVDAWKADGWNDGTTTLFGVYQFGVSYRLFSFPDYGEPASEAVTPKIEHTGWEGLVGGEK